MSKPDPTGAKSLEEILASIRRSLADEGTDRPTEARVAPVKAAQPQPKPPAPAAAPANGAGLLPGKLAGALNGAAAAPTLDDDLTELLATEPKKSAPAAPANSARPSAAGSGDPKDPLWFLTRLSAAAAGNAPQGSAARARDAAKAPAAAEEVKLSRPETLRASLPPLFSGGDKPAPTARAPADAGPAHDKADTVSLTEKTQPRVLQPLTDVAAATSKAEPEAPVAAPAAKTPAEPASPVAQTLQREAEARPSEVVPQAPLSLDPAAAAETAVAPLADSASAANPMPGGAPQPRGLEQMMAELLEPVIRQWLQSNLPRMIEKVVREEAARAIAAEREASKV
jgi:cell pole-organizing protein PopZ